MKCEISSNRIVIGSGLRQHIEDRLQQSFQRLGRWVQKVSICLEDINGPRGGICKQCRLVVTLSGVESVIVTETAPSVHASVTGAFRRASHALRRRVKSVKSYRRTQVKQRQADHQRQIAADLNTASGQSEP